MLFVCYSLVVVLCCCGASFVFMIDFNSFGFKLLQAFVSFGLLRIDKIVARYSVLSRFG